MTVETITCSSNYYFFFQKSIVLYHCTNIVDHCNEGKCQNKVHHTQSTVLGRKQIVFVATLFLLAIMLI